jgi:hypothetical protein
MGSPLRILTSADESALFSFLMPRLETSLFFISNAQRGGLEDRGEPLQGTYVGYFRDGEITALATHYWNGVVMLQGDVGLEAAAAHAVEVSGRAVTGLIGPLALTARIRSALGWSGKPTRKDDAETLFALDLDELVVPSLLASSGIVLRRATAADVADRLAAWRTDYLVHSLGAQRCSELEKSTREDLSRSASKATVVRGANSRRSRHCQTVAGAPA